MDLIERAAAIEEIDDTVTSVSVCATVEQARGATWAKKRIRERLEKMPTIEAVPLDALCEWLAENALEFPRILTDQGEAISAESWKRKLKKWMESKKDA